MDGLLLLLSCIQLCATPQTAAQKAPPSLGFSRQEHWSGLPFPSPVHESEVAQSCPTLRDPVDCSLPGSSVPGIFQARVLEWGAIAFSETPGVTGKFGLGSTERSRAKANRVLPRKCTGHSKHPLPTTTQEKTLHMDITRWSTPKSD